MKRIRSSQLDALIFLVILSPALRLIPQRAATAAGRVGWLSPLAVYPLLAVYALFLSLLWRRQPEGVGMAEFALRELGDRGGRLVLFLFSAWFLFYGGFLLRVGADRLVVAVYPQASPRPFLLSMGALCLFAALGSLQSLARSAKLILPLLLGMLLGIFLLSLRDVQRTNLFPVTLYDLPAVFRAGASAADILGLGLFLPLFLLPLAEKTGNLRSRLLRQLSLQTLLLSLLSLTVIGKFGAELVSQLTHPFFTLVRNLVLFHSFERMEALVVSCWIFPDFLLISLCFYAAQYCLRSALGAAPLPNDGRRFSMARQRWLIPLCSLAAVAVGLLLAPDLKRLRLLSEKLIPDINLFLCFLSPPLIALGGKLRSRSLRLSLRELLRRLPRKRTKNKGNTV